MRQFDITKVSKFYWIFFCIGGVLNSAGYMLMIFAFAWHDQAIKEQPNDQR